MNPIIVVEHLRKHYPNGNVLALNDVSFEIPSGIIVTVTGKSGCGKTTLLNMLGGLDKPTSGKVVINSCDITQMNERHLMDFRATNIGFVFQFFNLLEELTSEENILFPAAIRKRKVDDDYYKKICDLMDIQRILPKHPAQLSGGENQRVAIARALIMQPAVVLMDEPTGHLDEENKLRVSTLISELNEQLGQTFIIVTHDPELAALGSFRIVMRDGKIDRVI